MPRRVLIVSYSFPPTGGVGVLRMTKFTKYLAQYGWQPAVLTVSNPSVPLFDEALCREIPPETIIRKARTLEPGYAVKEAVTGGKKNDSPIKQVLAKIARRVTNVVLQPDPQILWRRNAVREGMKLLKEIPHDLILTSGPPFSSFLVGADLAKRSGLPLILDYRDEWSISNAYWENKQHGFFSNWIQNRMQRQVVCAAAHLLATTPSSAQALAEVARESGSRANSTFIYNGFDETDFQKFRTEPHARVDYGHGTDKFRMSFIGTLWNLATIEPVVAGIELLASKNPELLSRLELVLAGRRTGDQEAILDRLNGLPCAVVRLPFVEHHAAIKLMLASDALMLINSDLPNTSRIVNYKTFEYMAARRPLLCVCPPGDIWEIVKALPGSMLCPPKDVPHLAECLSQKLDEHRRGVNYDSAAWNIEKYERRSQTRELAELMETVVTHHVNG